MLNISARALKRRAIRRLPVAERPEAKPQPTIVSNDGYRTLRPTKGWLFISKARAAAGQAIANLHEITAMRAVARQMGRVKVPPKNDSAIYRKQGNEVGERRFLLLDTPPVAEKPKRTRKAVTATPPAVAATAEKPKRVRKPRAAAQVAA